MSRSAQGRIRRFLLSLLVTLTLLLVGEGSLRVWAYFFRHPYQQFDSKLGIITLVPAYQGQVDGEILQINSRGLRAAEVSPAKPPHVYRIITLGDSVTFGRAGDSCHYPGVLQQLFVADGDSRVEVINAAVEGYNSRDALRRLEGQLLAYSPDLITVLIGWNDLVKQDPARPSASALEARLAYALYDVYLLKFWRRVIYFHLRPMLLRVDTDLSPEEQAAFRTYVPLVYKENLEQIIAAARGAGSQIILFTLPSSLRPDMTPKDIRNLYFPHFTYNLMKFRLLYERYNETIRAVGRGTGVPVIELQDAIRGRESELFMDTAHLECEGYQILGAHIYKSLSQLIRRKPHPLG